MSTPEGVTFHKGRFVVQISLGKDPITGKRKRKQYTVPPCDNHAADGTVPDCRACKLLARDFRAEKLVELKGAHYVEASSMTLGTWLDIFLEAHAGRRRKSTVAGYRSKVDTIIRPRIGDLRLQDITGTKLEAFYARLAEGDDLRPQGYALATIRQTHAVISRALRDASRPRGTYLAFNPAIGLELPGSDDGDEDVVKVLRTWTSAQLRTFLAAARDHEHGAYFYTAAVTGMRRSELAGLRWDMVDLDRGLIRVERSRHVVGGEQVWSRPKSARGRRVIELSSTQAGVLRGHRRAQAELRLAAGSGWEDNDLVFTDEGGNGPPLDDWSRSFQQIIARLDVPRIRLHDLRHTHATLLLEQGRPVKEVSERLGHSTTAFTMDVYGHVTDAMRTATAGVIDEILGG